MQTYAFKHSCPNDSCNTPIAEPSGGPSKPGRLLRSGRWAKGSAIYPPLKAYGTVGPTIALPAVVRLLAAPKQIE